MRTTLASVASCLACVLLVACATPKPARTGDALAGQKVKQAGTTKEWKEGDQEPGESTSTGKKGDDVAAENNEKPLTALEDSGTSPRRPGEGGKDEPTPQPPPSGRGSKEVFPFVRVDVAAKTVEFDAEVPAYAYVGKDGVVYLEVIVCTRDTREHETVLVTPARAADVHAAMLMIGLVPGAPGGWEWIDKTIVPVPPKGDPVDVSFVLERNGKTVEEPAAAWIYNVATGKLLADEVKADEGFLFAGSAFVNKGGGERYAADGAGTLVGLATFGTETIAWNRVFSPESSVDEPVWAVKRDVQPPAGTKVIVKINKRAQ